MEDLMNLEATEVSSNINLLDDNKNALEGTSSSPTDLLKEYSDFERKNLEVQKKLEDFRQAHLEIFEEYQAMLDEIETNIKQQSNLKDPLTKAMSANELKTISDDLFKVTYVAPTTRKNFDKKNFEKDHEELYNQYITISEVSDYVKITSVD
jgi:hypothetical protein